MEVLERIIKKLNSKKEQERVYILDTCALNSSEAMEIIEEASKIIILTGVIQELDNNKHNPCKRFSDRVCEICRKSREDYKSEKYVCVSGYDKYPYEDDNIIDYCRKNKNVTILTCDNNLCNKAKAYGIPYIFPKRDDKEKVTVNSQNKEIQETKKKNPNTMVKGVIFKDGNLYASNNSKQFFLFRKGEMLRTNSDVKLEIGDIIIRIKNVHQEIVIRKYEICEIRECEYAYLHTNVLKKIKTSNIQKLENADLPTEVKKKVLDLLNIKEQKSDTKKEMFENQSQGIYFYKRWIRVENDSNHINYIKVERQGKIINTQDYSEGDLLYISKYNKKQNNLEIYVYEIGVKNNQYVVKELNKYKLWFVNEIYSLKLSKELQDEIRVFFVKHARF